jgi:hypothetical protein
MAKTKKPLSPAARKIVGTGKAQAAAEATLNEVQLILGQWRDGLISGEEADNKLVMLLANRQY